MLLLVLLVGCISSPPRTPQDNGAAAPIFDYKNLQDLQGKYNLEQVDSKLTDFEMRIKSDKGISAKIEVQGKEKRDKTIEGVTMEQAVKDIMASLGPYGKLSCNSCEIKRSSQGEDSVLRATCEDFENILFISVTGADEATQIKVMEDILLKMVI